MKDDKLRGLISDVNVLVYIHDVLLIEENDEKFIYSDTYKQLHESNFLTTIKYLRKTAIITFSFFIIIYLLKQYYNEIFSIRYILFALISILYGFLIVSCKEDVKSLKYQIKAKVAVQYALENYTYNDYVLFLDQYLSEVSTKGYKVKKRFNNRKY